MKNIGKRKWNISSLCLLSAALVNTTLFSQNRVEELKRKAFQNMLNEKYWHVDDVTKALRN
jgi:hypothetical protein